MKHEHQGEGLGLQLRLVSLLPMIVIYRPYRIHARYSGLATILDLCSVLRYGWSRTYYLPPLSSHAHTRPVSLHILIKCPYTYLPFSCLPFQSGFQYGMFHCLLGEINLPCLLFCQLSLPGPIIQSPNHSSLSLLSACFRTSIFPQNQPTPILRCIQYFLCFCLYKLLSYSSHIFIDSTYGIRARLRSWLSFAHQPLLVILLVSAGENRQCHVGRELCCLMWTQCSGRYLFIHW